jgi:glycosyltransferase EpsD
MKKVLFIANHAGFSKFNAPYFDWFKTQNWVVHNASPGLEVGTVDKQYDIPISRNPLSLKNIKAYIMLRKICKQNCYDIIHCHTPVGGILGRLCGRVCKSTRIIYTAHGFHFYKGAGILAWLLYYPVEKVLSYITDCIVTINQEDYNFAKKHFSTTTDLISGVGVNVDKFSPVNANKRKELRVKNGLQNDDFILIYCAQFIKRKNHKFLINIAKELKSNISNLEILFVGSGVLENKIKKNAFKASINEYVHFLGYRRDVEELYQLSDLLVSTSKQEGFGINIVEGMAVGLPVVCSDIRGHEEIINGVNGFKVSLNDEKSFVEKIKLLNINNELYKQISYNNICDVVNYKVDHSVDQMATIYKRFL